MSNIVHLASRQPILIVGSPGWSAGVRKRRREHLGCRSWSGRGTARAITTQLILVFLMLVAISSPGAAGTIGTDGRLAIADYARQHDMDAISVRRLFGASGRIKCPSYAASAFLVYRSDIVLTARHVVIPTASTNSYADWQRPTHCGFELSADGITSTWYDVDVTTMVYPLERLRSSADRFDWIAMKLTKPVPAVIPYKLSSTPPAADDSVTSITVRQEGLPYQDWNERIVESCMVRNVVDIDEIAGSGLQIDCSATQGASGGAVVRPGADGLEVVGVLTASSNSCKEYDALSCFTFALGISEDIKRAIHSLAGEQ